jgi:hypothetical protein
MKTPVEMLKEELRRMRIDRDKLNDAIKDRELALASMERGGLVSKGRIVTLVKEFLATRPKGATFVEILEYAQETPGVSFNGDPAARLRQSLSLCVTKGTIARRGGLFFLAK